jgi:hypothetical protein
MNKPAQQNTGDEEEAFEDNVSKTMQSIRSSFNINFATEQRIIHPTSSATVIGDRKDSLVSNKLNRTSTGVMSNTTTVHQSFDCTAICENCLSHLPTLNSPTVLGEDDEEKYNSFK